MSLRLTQRFRCRINPSCIKYFSSRSFESGGEVTHTGQVSYISLTEKKFDKSDYRNVRFSQSKKLVNKNFAIDLIAEQPAIPIKNRIAVCDGGGGPLGHPKVYINLDQEGEHACGYCGLRFFKEGH